MKRVTAYGAAKVNVGWHVGPRREDGYHDVLGCVQTVSLLDRLDLEIGEPDDGAHVVEVDGVPISLRAPEELATDDNIVFAAARAMAEKAEARPTRITLEKSIPLAAGLGGGSADAAATLVALDVLWRARRPPAGLVALGAEVGSDVPAILVGGLVHASGRGEIVRRIGTTEGYAFVLAIPDERVSAGEAYAALDELRAKGAETGQDRPWHRNDLEDATAQIVPSLPSIRTALAAAVRGPVFQSGSGPVLAGVVADGEPDPAALGELATVVARIEVARPIDWGVRLVMDGS